MTLVSFRVLDIWGTALHRLQLLWFLQSVGSCVGLPVVQVHDCLILLLLSSCSCSEKLAEARMTAEPQELRVMGMLYNWCGGMLYHCSRLSSTPRHCSALSGLTTGACWKGRLRSHRQRTGCACRRCPAQP